MGDRMRIERTLPLSRLGFTLVELLLVATIIALLGCLGAPLFSRFFKNSKVQQGAQTVFTAVWQSRFEAQSQLGQYDAGIFLGDEDSKMQPAPVADVLPSRGQAVVQLVHTNRELIGWTAGPYCPESPSNVPAWYPYCYPLRNLTPVPLTLPDDIRVICGEYVSGTSGGKPYRTFYCPQYQKSAKGLIKRHSIVFSRNGMLSDSSYGYMLIFEPSSGAHLILEVGTRGAAATRPRIVIDPSTHQPAALTHIGLRGKYLPTDGDVKELKDYHEIEAVIDSDPGDL